MMKNKYYRSVLAAAILAGLVCMGGLGSGSQGTKTQSAPYSA